MLPIRQNNPLAPPAYNGLSSIDPGYEDKDFGKLAVYSLTANQILLNQAVQLDKDADFILSAIEIQNALGTGAPFSIRFADSTGYYLSDNFIGSFAFVDSYGLGSPYVILPSLHFPAGSAILVDIQDLSGSNNGPINVLFRGQKRYYK